jgi:hypothetical protein
MKAQVLTRMIGDIILASARDLQRLVLVRALHPGKGYAEVYLVTEDIEDATDADFLLPPALTGMPMDLAIESDVIGVVWLAQLGEALGHVDEGIGAGIEALAAGIPDWDLRSYQGMPLLGPLDRRWGRKENEALEMQELGRDCAEALMRDQETRTDPGDTSNESLVDDPAGLLILAGLGPEVVNLDENVSAVITASPNPWIHSIRGPLEAASALDDWREQLRTPQSPERTAVIEIASALWRWRIGVPLAAVDVLVTVGRATKVITGAPSIRQLAVETSPLALEELRKTPSGLLTRAEEIVSHLREAAKEISGAFPELARPWRTFLRKLEPEPLSEQDRRILQEEQRLRRSGLIFAGPGDDSSGRAVRRGQQPIKVVVSGEAALSRLFDPFPAIRAGDSNIAIRLRPAVVESLKALRSSALRASRQTSRRGDRSAHITLEHDWWLVRSETPLLITPASDAETLAAGPMLRPLTGVLLWRGEIVGTYPVSLSGQAVSLDIAWPDGSPRADLLVLADSDRSDLSLAAQWETAERLRLLQDWRGGTLAYEAVLAASAQSTNEEDETGWRVAGSAYAAECLRRLAGSGVFVSSALQRAEELDEEARRRLPGAAAILSERAKQLRAGVAGRFTSLRNELALAIQNRVAIDRRSSPEQRGWLLADIRELGEELEGLDTSLAGGWARRELRTSSPEGESI